VFLLAAGVQGWFLGGRSAWFIRVGLVVAALFLISGGFVTDVIGVGIAVAAFFVQRVFHPDPNARLEVKGAD
jgi:UPF0716 family protein affecting phage T7 exclusion